MENHSVMKVISLFTNESLVKAGSAVSRVIDVRPAEIAMSTGLIPVSLAYVVSAGSVTLTYEQSMDEVSWDAATATGIATATVGNDIVLLNLAMIAPFIRFTVTETDVALCTFSAQMAIR